MYPQPPTWNLGPSSNTGAGPNPGYDPSRPAGGPPRPSGAPSTSYVPPPPPLGAPSNGPAGGMMSTLQPAHSGSVSLLRVVLADAARLDAPVAVGSGLLPSASSASATPKTAGLELENSLIEASSVSYVEQYFSSPGFSLEESLVDAETAQFVGMGFSRTAASLAVAYGKINRIPADKVMDFARNYTELTEEMGFSPLLAAGALVKHGNKMEDAADACLAVAAN